MYSDNHNEVEYIVFGPNEILDVHSHNEDAYIIPLTETGILLLTAEKFVNYKAVKNTFNKIKANVEN